MDSSPAVSVIMPVRNEEHYLPAALHRILGQNYPGELQVVLAVAPSRDRTEGVAAELAEEYPGVTVVPNPTGRTPAGLNAAIAASKHDIVARVDGHAILPDDYLRLAVDAMRQTGADNVGGIMAAEGVTAFEQAVARAMTSRVGVGNARFHTGGAPGPADTVYLGVFDRSALERVGGYDESFLRAQDWEMNYRIRRSGGLVWFTPTIEVCYRPRSSLPALARQYFDYGRWRRAVARRTGSINLRYLTPPTAVSVMAMGVGLGLAGLPLGLLAPGGYVAGVLAASAWTGRGLPAKARASLPLVYVTMHCSWGVGFLTSPRGLGRGREFVEQRRPVRS